MTLLVGHKVSLTTNDNLRLTGFIQAVDEEHGKITLFQVTIHHSGENLQIQGLQHYYGSEIKDLEILEEVKASVKTNGHHNPNAQEPGRSIMFSKYIPSHLPRLQFLDHNSLMLKMDDTLANTDNVEEQESGIECGGNEVDPKQRLLKNYTVLDDSCSQIFKKAIEYLSEQAVLAVSFEAITLGRNGKLCWILMASKEHTFYFDVLTMGSKCMIAGIKDIFESDSILKVIHDSRLPSDMMFHQYNVLLNNIFDTQVASVFVYRIHHGGDFPRYVSGLAECLLKELHLPDDQVHIMLVRAHCPEDDEKVWSIRPAPVAVLDAAYKHVCHLLHLRKVLMEKMQIQFITGVNIYLTNVKDADNARAKRLQKATHRLPSEFLELDTLVELAVHQEKLRQPRIPLKYVAGVTRDQQGLKENCRGVVHPAVVASRDSIWHKAGNRGLHSGKINSNNREKTNSIHLKPRSVQSASRSEPKKQQDTHNTANGIAEISHNAGNLCSSTIAGDSAFKKNEDLGSPIDTTRLQDPVTGSDVLLQSGQNYCSHNGAESPEQARLEIPKGHLKSISGTTDSFGSILMSPLRLNMRNQATKVQNNLADEQNPASPFIVPISNHSSKDDSYDIIPSHSELVKKRVQCALSGPSSHLNLKSFPCVDEETGFRLDSFHKIQNPELPLAKDSADATFEAKLADILPTASSDPDLCPGARPWPSRIKKSSDLTCASSDSSLPIQHKKCLSPESSYESESSIIFDSFSCSIDAFLKKTKQPLSKATTWSPYSSSLSSVSEDLASIYPINPNHEYDCSSFVELVDIFENSIPGDNTSPSFSVNESLLHDGPFQTELSLSDNQLSHSVSPGRENHFLQPQQQYPQMFHEDSCHNKAFRDHLELGQDGLSHKADFFSEEQSVESPDWDSLHPLYTGLNPMPRNMCTVQQQPPRIVSAILGPASNPQEILKSVTDSKKKF